MHYRRPKSHAVGFDARQSPGQRIAITMLSDKPFNHSGDFCGNGIVG
jgi:hypothetical protein